MKKFTGVIFAICSVLTFASCASAVTANRLTNSGTDRWPGWVLDPYTKYDRQENVARVGSGSSREAAEKNALGNLVAVFGQRIAVDERVSTSYQQAVRNGVIANWSEDTDVDNIISTSTGMDSLVGAEIGEVWDDGKEYYAVAVLNKAKAIQIYSGIVKANQTTINNLVGITEGEKNSLEGFARYQFAAIIADITIPYLNLLSVIGGPSPLEGFKSGDDYRLEVLSITKAIPVGLRVRNDKSGRIEGAFAKAISDLGFQIGGNNSRYMLDVNIVTSAVEITNNPYKWTRIELNANLIDTYPATVMLPYNFNDREGHTSQSEADNRAYMAAERKINEEYAKRLSDYLSGLTPKK